MKRKAIIVLLIGVLVTTTSLAQSMVPRNKVLLEIFSGTWCVFCPGSELGARDMKKNELDVAIIKHHMGDPYQNASTEFRDSMYFVTAFPTSVFNGDSIITGGNVSSSIYATYYPIYLASLDMTPIQMEMNLRRLKGTVQDSILVEVDVTKLGPYSNDLVLYVAISESHISESWFGLSEVNNVNRGIFPNPSGISLNLVEGMKSTYSLKIPYEANWEEEWLETVVWIQDPNTQIVANADAKSAYLPDELYEVSLDKVVSLVNPTQCQADENDISFTVINPDADTVTSMTFDYQLNNGTIETYTWNGILAYSDTATVTLPTIINDGSESNQLGIVLKLVNGNQDQNVTNNILVSNWSTKYTKGGQFTLELLTDYAGSETTWEIVDGGGNIVSSGGPYFDGGPLPKTHKINIPETPDCYSLNFYDSNGDGMQAVSNGFYRLMDADSNVLVSNVTGEFGSLETNKFEVTSSTSIEKEFQSLIEVFPNPSHGLFSILNEASFLDAQWQLISLDGRTIQSGVIEGEKWQLDLSNEAEGIYLLNIIGEKQSYQQKLVKK
ncbi:MAG: T9SS type A sorting domain-containing protein [Bacteroidota bacterium]